MVSFPRQGRFIERLTHVLGLIAVVVELLLAQGCHQRAAPLPPATPPVVQSVNPRVPSEEPLPPAAQARMPRAVSSERLDPSVGSEQVTLSWMKEILQALATDDLTARDHALTYLLPALVEKDASAAGVLAEANTAPGSREDLMRRVAQLWAGQDATGALAWAAALSDAHERNTTLSDVCQQIARDPERAAWLRRLPSGPLREYAEKELARMAHSNAGEKAFLYP